MTRRYALRMTNDEQVFLDAFRQVDWDPYPCRLAWEVFGNSTIASVQRKGWVEKDGEVFEITELGRIVFGAACAQDWHCELVK